ncbi:cellulose binding, type IV [Lysobacter dokdonensis DS-58]|uniref:Cellulose binding, type IV n=1 Tax=Lysobacter dokdonensis DS-58 TaxID=1300345 RepID=A0A0A2WIN7_9GAMM|nr:hypothetical protein [Lysobacter dokdonensis]KGQ20056.1 cellulose binding, type IV [Lysobacter dokdonensis DS-58]
MHRFLFALALAGACASACAQDAPTPTEQETDALATAATRGVALWRLDRAAVAAEVVANDTRKFRKDERVTGFTTRQDGDAIVVSWVDTTPVALYRVRVGADGVAGELETLETPAALTPDEAAQARALAVAVPLVQPTCTESYRSLALPSGDARWSVYLLPVTTKEAVVPFGGSYRIDVADGAVASQRAYAKTCITLDTKPGTVATMVTSEGDATPTDVHVFWQLWSKTPMYVHTPRGLWAIQEGHAALLERPKGQ